MVDIIMIEQNRTVQFAYALDDMILTPINRAVRGKRYTCPNCGSPLVPVLGQAKSQHFRHATACCAVESYLHQCAKLAFLQMYESALSQGEPVSLTLKRVIQCADARLKLLSKPTTCLSETLALYDLTRFFGVALLEKRDNATGLQPDILLIDTHSDTRCYVEICVTHSCTPEKINRGIPILEFSISSHEDIQMILEGKFTVTDTRLKVYNWKPPAKTQTQCLGECLANSIEMDVWHLSASGRLKRQTVPLANVDLSVHTDVNTWETSLSQSDVIARLRLLLKHDDPSGDFPNCVRCQYAKDWESGYLYCQSKSKKVAYTEARQCASYQEFVCPNS